MEQTRWQRLLGHVGGLKPLASFVLEGGAGTIRQGADVAFARLARLTGQPGSDGTTCCSGDFVVLVDGSCYFLLQTTEKLARNWASDLRLSGSDPIDGPWTLEAPEAYILIPGTSANQNWAVAEPINKPVVVRYGKDRPAARALALFNNLQVPERTRVVKAGDIELKFSPHPDGAFIRDLLDAGLLRTASLARCEFDCPTDASTASILQFCADVGALCTYATGHHNGSPLVTLFDPAGRVCARCAAAPIDSARGSQDLLLDHHTPGAFEQLFRECFEEHQRMMNSPLPWRRLPSYCACIEEGSYLEQKCSAVMTALEFFTRTSLREADPANAERYADLTLPALIGTARKVLHWNVPKHYVAKDLYRKVRNAVAHGGDLPTADNKELRLLFDKWRLFLFRRVLIRLGYTGRIASPNKGWASSSAVDDFSDEHNTFEVVEPSHVETSGPA